jgi:hypothetical protein
MKTSAEILTIVDASQRDIENWVSRLKLSTEFHETVRGRARLYSRANTLELAYIAALVRGGAELSKAAVFAAGFVRHAQGNDWKKSLREWFVFPSGDLRRGIGSNNVDIAAIQKEFGSVTLTLINVGELVRRVNSLFKGEE